MITRDRRQQNTHYQLFIETVKKEDGGNYQCAASNIAGEKASIEVNLHANDLGNKIMDLAFVWHRGHYLAFLAVCI